MLQPTCEYHSEIFVLKSIDNSLAVTYKADGINRAKRQLPDNFNCDKKDVHLEFVRGG